MMSNRFAGALLGLGLVAGCGGKAVVDGSAGGGGEGAGGATTTTTVTTSGTTTVTTSGTSTVTTSGTTTVTTTDLCSLLQDELNSRFIEATACNPALSVEQCTGDVVVYDTCGCEAAANNTTPEVAASAVDAYQTWVDAGCGPWLCEWCPPGPPAPWSCMPDPSGDGGSCQPVWMEQ